MDTKQELETLARIRRTLKELGYDPTAVEGYLAAIQAAGQ